MDRRNFVRGMMAAAVCPVCARMALAAEGAPWSYAGETGPEHWGALADENAACSVGARQSPVDIAEAIRAELPPLRPDWKPGGTMVNNGHTIQVAVPAGSTLARGDRLYTLVQFHFHAPSEHLVAGRPAAMEVHFVHRAVEGSGLGVLGVLMEPGDANPAFARLAAAFPGEPGGMAATDVDPAGLLPPSLAYWSYEGSLTTPPCSEIVDWMVAMQPVAVDAADIARFAALYPMNARPVLPANRPILASE